jgi:hypothetical protein
MTKAPFKLIIMFLLLMNTGCIDQITTSNTPPVPTNYPQQTKIDSSRDDTNSNPLPKGNWKQFDDHSFIIELENWGEVQFISGKTTLAVFQLMLFLTDLNKNVIYEFPDFNRDFELDALRAVSFKDLNQDGLKDVIVIAEYMTGVGPEGAVPFPVAGIYFQRDKQFIRIPELDEAINKQGKNESIDEIVDYVSGKLDGFKFIAPTESIYENTKLGFSLRFPESWEGKYTIDERPNSITVFHKVPLDQKNVFFSIFIHGTETQWNEYLEGGGEDGWPLKKLGMKEGLVYVKSAPTDYPYDTRTEELKRWAKEYDMLNTYADRIISSFSFLNEKE